MAIKERHKIAFMEVAKGRSVKDAMLIAGYSPKTAKNTHKLKRTLGWKELTEKFLPDKLLAKVHREGLEATQFIPQGVGKGETELVEVPDYSVRHKYLKSAYDLKGRLSDNSATGVTIGVARIIITMPQEAILEPPQHVEHEEINPEE